MVDPWDLLKGNLQMLGSKPSFRWREMRRVVGKLVGV